MHRVIIVALLLAACAPSASVAPQPKVQSRSGEVVDGVLQVDLAIDTTLPKAVVAVTLCNLLTGRPVIVARQEPDSSTLVHEMVHVQQVMREGGCPKGWEKLTATPQSLLAAEAEAYCVEARWEHLHYGKEVRKTLVEALRALRELSIIRAKTHPDWELQPGDISHALTQACPDAGEPHYPSGTVLTGITGTEPGAPQFADPGATATN